MRIVFMGTPDFGVPILQKLADSGYEIVAAVSQPDRPKGRSGRPVPPPVKQLASSLNIPVLQPESIREPAAVEELRGLAPDIIVVAAFGQILPKSVLAIPRIGFLNVHAALLPKYRGAWPIGAAILAGERQTGVTIMLVEPKLDTGPILAQQVVPIEPRDTTATLSRRLAEAGADLLLSTIPRWVSGELQPRRQDESVATYIPMITKEQGSIDWTQPAEVIDRRCRAYFPWPGCYTTFRGRLLKVIDTRPLSEWRGRAAPGEVLPGNGEELVVATGGGALAILELQLEGKRVMSAAEFRRGQPDLAGSILR